MKVMSRTPFTCVGQTSEHMACAMRYRESGFISDGVLQFHSVIGMHKIADNCKTKKIGGGVRTFLNLDDIICEQGLNIQPF